MHCINKMTRQALSVAVACLLVALHANHLGHPATTARLLQTVEASSFEAFDLTPKINGLSYMLEPQHRRQQLIEQHQRQQQLQQQQQQQLQRARQLQLQLQQQSDDQQADNDQALQQQDQVKRASFKDVESGDSRLQQNQQLADKQQDLSRLIGLDEILESLALSIPSASLVGQRPSAAPQSAAARQVWRKNRTSAVADWRPLLDPLDDGGSFGQQVVAAAAAPGRPTPAPTFGSAAGARLAAAKAPSEQWPGAVEEVPAAALSNMLEGNSLGLASPKSRKSSNAAGAGAGAAVGAAAGGLLGFVWPSRPLSSSSSSAAAAAAPAPTGGEPTPIFIDTHHNYLQQKHLAANARKLAQGRPVPTTVSPSALSPPPTGSAHHNNHHRLGTEEVALHTPIHSHMGSDYEWKRVENSRSWNNLRGMWGKRAISEPFTDPETFRDAIEQEARESDLEPAKGAAAPSVLVDTEGDEASDGGPRQSRQIDPDEVARQKRKIEPATTGPVAAM